MIWEFRQESQLDFRRIADLRLSGVVSVSTPVIQVSSHVALMGILHLYARRPSRPSQSQPAPWRAPTSPGFHSPQRVLQAATDLRRLST